MDALSRLQQWYAGMCDGDWEHQQGVTIGTLDNPGWMLEIDLVDTPLERRELEAVRLERTETDWVDCFIRDGKFIGACGPCNLTELIERFLAWASEEA